MAFSYDKIRAARAETAKQKMSVEASKPANDSPEAIREAMKKSRLREIAAQDPNDPEIPKLLAKHKDLFNEFLNNPQRGANRVVDMNAERVAGDIEKIAQGSIEFRERIQYAEQIKEMITPALINRLVESGAIAEDLSFNAIAGMATPQGKMTPEILVDIVRGQMLAMACRNPERFENLARSIELSVMHQSTEEYQEREQEVSKVLTKYKLTSEEYDTFAKALTTPDLSGPEKYAIQEALRDKVRRSKGKIFGFFQKGIDAGLERLKEREVELGEELDALKAQLNTANQHRTALVDGILIGARAEAAAHAEDPEHESHQVVAKTLELIANLDNRIDTLKKDQEFAQAALTAVTRDVMPIFKLTSSKGGAESLEEVIPKAEEALKKVQEQMQEIALVLKATLEEDKGVRGEIDKVLKGTRAKPEPIPEPSYEQVEDFVPSQPLYQRGFDQYVAESRLDDDEEVRQMPREQFRESYRRREAERAKKNFEAKGKRGFFSFIFGTFFNRGAANAATKERSANLS